MEAGWGGVDGWFGVGWEAMGWDREGCGGAKMETLLRLRLWDESRACGAVHNRGSQ